MYTEDSVYTSTLFKDGFNEQEKRITEHRFFFFLYLIETWLNVFLHKACVYVYFTFAGFDFFFFKQESGFLLICFVFFPYLKPTSK